MRILLAVDASVYSEAAVNSVIVDRVAQRLEAAGFRATTATPDADARHGIVDYAAEWSADLIVMGSHGQRV